MKPKSISIEKININEAAQPRVTLDDAYTEELTKDLQSGSSEFPPVVVFKEVKNIGSQMDFTATMRTSKLV